MSTAKTGKVMSPKLLKVAERASRDPNARLLALAHLLDEDALKRAFGRIRKNAAVGVDGITKEQYGRNLARNLQVLHERLRTQRYRHQPIRRVHIPKAGGKTRPIGLSCIEDKIVQGALSEVLGAIYEQDFLPSSYGFRPGRSAHDALRAVDRMVFRERVKWILEADIQTFFDSLDRSRLREMLRTRVADRSFMRLVGKCLHVGVLDGVEVARPEQGTVQGSIISPLLGNVYLHYALDVWYEREVVPTLTGGSRLIRYADDFVIGFQRQEDAERVLEWLTARMAEFGLTLHPEKTRILAFTPPHGGSDSGKGTGTFDFLGFTAYWRRGRQGRWRLAMKTRKASLRRALIAVNVWCRSHRHWSRKDQHAALSRSLRGHYNYFGVNGNYRSLQKLLFRTRYIWLRWLRRRSQRGHRLTWERFMAYLKASPLPAPQVTVRLWGGDP